MGTVEDTDIRGLLLQILAEALHQSRNPATTKPVVVPLHEGRIMRHERIRGLRADLETEQSVLFEWQELFRTGYLSWGHSLEPGTGAEKDGERWKHPWFHISKQGLRSLAYAERDPSNPVAYLSHLRSRATISDVARSYLTEALDSYAAGRHKAAAVLLGGASERLMVDVREAVLARSLRLSETLPAKLNSVNWQVKQVLDGLKAYFDQNSKGFAGDLKERYDSHWRSFTQQIRGMRNEVGHPTSIDPITPDEVHAAFLVFPQIANISTDLIAWTRA